MTTATTAQFVNGRPAGRGEPGAGTAAHRRGYLLWRTQAHGSRSGKAALRVLREPLLRRPAVGRRRARAARGRLGRTAFDRLAVRGQRRSLRGLRRPATAVEAAQARGRTRCPCPARPRRHPSHVAEFGTAPDGRLFPAQRTGGAVRVSVYARVWQQARVIALSREQGASPLARRPYDLRHAALSRLAQCRCPADRGRRAGRACRGGAALRVREASARRARDVQRAHRRAARRAGVPWPFREHSRGPPVRTGCSQMPARGPVAFALVTIGIGARPTRSGAPAPPSRARGDPS